LPFPDVSPDFPSSDPKRPHLGLEMMNARPKCEPIVTIRIIKGGKKIEEDSRFLDQARR
jgi:hypothetical protein